MNNKMKRILQYARLAFMFALTSCATPVAANKESEKDYFLARVTFYTDCPTYGKKTASSRIAEEGTTIAAAKTVPFGTKFRIPRLKEWMNTDGVFRTDDRGPALDKRTASRGKLPVIDVYVSSHEKVKQFGARSNNIFKVYHITK
jgi:3D (Asp-Asp-Asp) domain-containing protein